MVGSRLAILDDSKLFREGLSCMLSRQFSNFLDTFDQDFAVFEQSHQDNPYDYLILDMHLGLQSGADYCWRLKKKYPDLKILGISQNIDELEVLKFVAAGADGFISKNSSIDEVKLALASIGSNELYFSDTVLKKAKAFKDTTMIGLDTSLGLSERELEILELVVEEELTNQDIANLIFLSPRTVETHKRNIIQKLGVNNTIGLTKFYFNYKSHKSRLYGDKI